MIRPAKAFTFSAFPAFKGKFLYSFLTRQKRLSFYCRAEESHRLSIHSERTDFKVGVAYSDYSCAVYSAGESLTKTLSLPKGESPVVGIKFSPSSKNILYTANRQGIVTAYDLRAKGKAVATITGNYEILGKIMITGALIIYE